MIGPYIYKLLFDIGFGFRLISPLYEIDLFFLMPALD